MKKYSNKTAPDGLKSKMARMRENRTLRSYVWMYFMMFTVFILVLLWLFQYFFLAKYYQTAKVRNIQTAAKAITRKYDKDNIQNITRRLAFENELCILVTDETGKPLLFENNLGSYSVFKADIDNWGMFVFQLKTELNNQSSDYITKIHENENVETKEIFYCTKFYSERSDQPMYLYIEGTVDPINSTVSIIREQLIYITIILIELAFIVTMFISARLSRPIVEITRTAKKFGEGDYSVDFDAKGYREIEELSTVLDNAKDEIQKVSDLRRDLVANISHDLRTPLTIVKSYAEMIRDLSGDNPEKRNEHLEVIIDENFPNMGKEKSSIFNRIRILFDCIFDLMRNSKLLTRDGY